MINSRINSKMELKVSKVMKLSFVVIFEVLFIFIVVVENFEGYFSKFSCLNFKEANFQH